MEEIFYKNPKIDYLMIYFNIDDVPTKQDKFSKLDNVVLKNEQSEEDLVLENLYYKKDDKVSVKMLDKMIKDHFADKKIKKIYKPNHVEVYISISTKTEKRFKEVDVDNLAKSILDCLNNVAFEDDSQVTQLISTKHIDKLNTNSICIGITELSETKKGLIGGIKVIQDYPWE